MHTIEPARLKANVTADALAEPAVAGSSSTVIRGKALIFWDRMSLPGTKFAKKLDASYRCVAIGDRAFWKK